MSNSSLESLYSASYVEARAKILERASAGPWQHEAALVPGQGREGEPLTIDVLAHRPHPDGPTLVISSGTHGVEGYFGSAVQLSILGSRTLPTMVNVVLVHATNPYGVSWGRRVTEENVDLNRNLLPPERFAALPHNGGYQELAQLFRGNAGSGQLFFWAKAVQTIITRGFAAAKQAVAGGQYQDQDGLFFGGAGPTSAHMTLAEHFPAWVGTATTVIHVDLHSGAGPWGTYTLQVSSEEDRRIFAEAIGCHASVERLSSDQTLYELSGGLHDRVKAWCQNTVAEYHFAYGEIGTYSALRVLAALRDENLAHAQCSPDEEIWSQANTRLREMFCPADASWRRTAIYEANTLVDKLIGFVEAKAS